MPELPDTRQTLLAKVGDSSNPEAWREFTAIYRPAVYRLARRRGLQDADADDLAQQVLLVISRKIADWRPTSPQGAFRRWLATIARHAIINALTRGHNVVAEGGSGVLQQLQNQPDRDTSLADIEEEFRRGVFRQAAESIRPEFQESTWNAFWLTAVEGLPIEEAADTLGKSTGTVYASRSRIMRRLKDKVQELEARQSEQ
ncbi:MAG: sigma-70 family RNA polymerase sigma factor [Planctomycetes bacterium]|nr:sigma-70 family RNA polymerase sigma factor [Planctomycetota bacterium]